MSGNMRIHRYCELAGIDQKSLERCCMDADAHVHGWHKWKGVSRQLDFRWTGEGLYICRASSLAEMRQNNR